MSTIYGVEELTRFWWTSRLKRTLKVGRHAQTIATHTSTIDHTHGSTSVPGKLVSVRKRRREDGWRTSWVCQRKFFDFRNADYRDDAYAL